MSDNGTKSQLVQCFLKVSIGGEILKDDIVVELDTPNYPKTCESFLSLCCNDIRTSSKDPKPTYRGCEFHRVVPSFCVQAGDWERFDGTGGFSPLYGRNWKDEHGANKHDREGVLSMANSGPNTNGSQFFVTLKSTPHLDGKHMAFGRVVSGMESVQKMVEVERGAKDRPVSLQKVVIEDCGRVVHKEEGYSKASKKSRKHRKRDKKKRHRRHHNDSSSDSYSSDESYGNASRSRKRKRHCRENHSRKHGKSKHRRRDSSDDESYSSSSSTYDSRGQKHKRRKSSREKSKMKKSYRAKKRRKDKKRR